MTIDPIEYTPIVVPMTVSVSDETIDMGVTSVIEAVKDYNRLDNKPSINGVELLGDKTANELDLAYKIRYGTTEEWSNRLDYIPAEGEIIVYTDYSTRDGINVPAIKVGDGLAYAADLPFASAAGSDEFAAHVANMVVHITAEERDFWNNKVRCYYLDDSVIFTTN